LYERRNSGLGQHIDVALLDCQVAMVANQNMNYMASGVSPRRAGNAPQNLVTYQGLEVGDGHLSRAVGNDRQFRDYCDVIGRPELAEDPRFQKNSGRVINREALIPMLADAMLAGVRDDWLARLEAAGVPAGPINTIEQVHQDPHVLARGLKLDVPHTTAGTLPTVASPLRLSETPVEYRRAAPLLGEHTAEVLQQYLNLSPEEIKELTE